jgi:hypothetical protein
MEPGSVIIVFSFVSIILILLVGGSSNGRKRHESEGEFVTNSALKRVVYNVRPGCVQAIEVYKTHSDLKKLDNSD